MLSSFIIFVALVFKDFVILRAALATLVVLQIALISLLQFYLLIILMCGPLATIVFDVDVCVNFSRVVLFHDLYT